MLPNRATSLSLALLTASCAAGPATRSQPPSGATATEAPTAAVTTDADLATAPPAPPVTTAPATPAPRQGAAVAPAPVENLDGIDATRVTLQLRDVPVAQALAAWSRASGTQAQVNATAPAAPAAPATRPSEGPMVTLDATDQPALAVLQAICRQAGLRPVAGYDSGGIVLQPGVPRDAGQRAAASAVSSVASMSRSGVVRRSSAVQAFANPAETLDDWATGPSVSNGPFLVTLTGIRTSRTTDPQRPQEVGRTLRLSLAVLAESKVEFVSNAPSMEVREVLDDAGRSVLPGGPEGGGDPYNTNVYPGSGGMGRSPNLWTANATVRVPAGVRQVTVRGALRTAVVTRYDELRVDDFAANAITEQERTLGGLRASVVDAPQPGYGNQRMVEVTLHRDATPPQAFQQQIEAIMQRHAPQMLDENGAPLQRGNYGSAGNGSEPDRRTYRFGFTKLDGTAPTGRLTFVWRIPTIAKPVAIPVEFRDVPVP